MNAGRDNYNIEWEDYKETVSLSFKQLRQENVLCDVTLVTDDDIHLSAHKVVLSACSTFFKSIFRKTSHPNPLLYLGSIDSKNMNYILDYVYAGKVQIFEEDVENFLKLAKQLNIEGLTLTDKNKSEVGKKGRSKSTKEDPKIDEVQVFLNTIEDISNEPREESRECKTRKKQLESNVSEDVQEAMDCVKVEEEPSLTRQEQFQSYQCNSCDSTFYDSMLLDVHSAMCHSESSEANTSIEETEMEETSVEDVIENVESKEEDKAGVQCVICYKHYKNKMSLAAHKSKYHRFSDEEEEMNETENNVDCNNFESTNNSLNTSSSIADPLQETERSTNTHIEDTHAEDLSSSRIKVNNMGEAEEKVKELLLRERDGFKCAMCGYYAKYWQRVALHIETHIDGLEYFCTFCDKQFKRKNTLLVHISNKHKQRS